MIADLMAAGLQSGCRVLRRPAIPEIWGVDIEVPKHALKGILRSSLGLLLGATASE